jgi:putative modified peptide
MTNKFSPDVVDKMLHALANDDEFRTAFEQDPREALRQLGHDTPEHHVGVEGKDAVLPFLSLQGGLASKEKIASSRSQLSSDYRSASEVGVVGSPFGPFVICRGDTA